MMVYKFFKKTSSGDAVKSEIISNQSPLDLTTRQLAEELHKSIIRKFEKRKICQFFKDDI